MRRALLILWLAGMVAALTPGTGRAIAISLWETEEALLASESSEYMQQQVAAVGEFLEEAAPSQTSFRVNGSWFPTAPTEES